MQFVSHPWVKKDAIESREYQEKIVKTAINGNTLVVIPTGLGKTNIAALVVADRLIKYKDKKILFLAPTRPLVEQHKRTFERIFNIGLEFGVVTGETSPELRAKLYGKYDIIFSTPQTIENDIKGFALDMKDFSLCIFDEAHRCVGNYAYTFIAKKYNYEAEHPLILALTASPGGHKYKIDAVKKSLFIKFVEIRTRDDVDVKPYIHKMEQNWVEVDLPISMKSIKTYLENIKNEKIKKLMSWGIIRHPKIGKAEILKLQESLAKRKTGPSFAAMSLLAEIIKVDHASMLLETQTIYSLKSYFDKLVDDNSKGGTKALARLLKNDDFRNAMRLTSELYKEGQEHPKLLKLREIIASELETNKFSRIIVFAQYRDTIARIYDELRKVKSAAPIEFIGQAKKKGKGLNQKEQVQILNEFKMGFYNILCASQVAEEGLDVVETDLVIFYEPTPSAIRKIQRSGRTARTKTGKVIILMTKDTRDQAYHWAAHHKEKQMHKTLYAMQKGQKDLDDFANESVL
jgi:Fanconi anemia group M protein